MGRKKKPKERKEYIKVSAEYHNLLHWKL
jgi:hypothetical protein